MIAKFVPAHLLVTNESSVNAYKLFPPQNGNSRLWRPHAVLGQVTRDGTCEVRWRSQ